MWKSFELNCCQKDNNYLDSVTLSVVLVLQYISLYVKTLSHSVHFLCMGGLKVIYCYLKTLKF